MKIRIIDLLNKITNEEEIPKKIKFRGIVYVYFDDTVSTSCLYKNNEYCTFLFMKYAVETILNDEVEIIEDKPIKRWRAGYKEDYFLLNSDGYIESDSDWGKEIDDFRYNIGNYFETEEEVEAYKERLLIKQELKDIALELNNGKEIDWKNYKSKYYLTYDNYYKKINVCFSATIIIEGTTYCLNKNFINVAIERIGKERLERYLKGE